MRIEILKRYLREWLTSITTDLKSQFESIDQRS